MSRAWLTAIVACGSSSSRPPPGADRDFFVAADGGGDAGAAPDRGPPPLEWPSPESRANSDPWLVEHHDAIRVMRPRLLALNFVNARSNDEMIADLARIVDGIRAGSRARSFSDPDAPAFLEYEIAYALDLRDAAPPAGWPYRNSTRYPREDPVEGTWGFDYERLFSDEFAGWYGFDLCDAVERGDVHEVWVYGDADVPDVAAAEVLELKPRFDEAGARLLGPMDRCAGNGCFDDEDEIPARCTRSLRIGWVNNTRGPGCFLESLGHGFESTGAGGTLPMLRPDFVAWADFDLDARYGLPLSSWYACGGAAGDCLTWTDETTVRWDVGWASGTIEGYVPRCGNAHFAPNSRNHYDDRSPYTVRSSCTHFGRGDGPGGADAAEPFSTEDFARYDALAPDCAGGWKIWWRQATPGLDAQGTGPSGRPLRNWWPYLFY